MTLFVLPNLSAQEVRRTDTVPEPVRPPFPNKDEYRAWCNHPDTEHAFVSLFEGINPNLRISESNPVCKIHGLIAEYDAKFHPDTRGMLFPPTHGVVTFSGNGRAVWPFAEPIPMDRNLWESFRAIAFKALRASTLAAGFQPVETRPEQYFEVGSWGDLKGNPIPVNILRGWLAEAAKTVKWSKSGTLLPIELVREEAAKRWPGRWPGGWSQFQVGERGTRFWDPSGDALSVIATEAGCVCFTGDQAFRSWSDIFGSQWVEKTKGEEIGNAVQWLYWDSNKASFFRAWSEDSPPRPIAREDLKLELRARGLNPKPPKGSLMSDQDTAIRMIQRFQCADVSAPLIYRPAGLVEHGGTVFLNTSRVRPFMPAPTTHDWGQGFPWIAQYFTNAFGENLVRFQSWWAHFYQQAIRGAPGTGLALAVVGSNNAGKNFFTNAILGACAGDKKDASKFVIGEDGFNEQLVASPLWTLHDAVVSGDNRKYSQNLKRIVANRELLTRGMYKEGIDVPWNGRVVITMNTDPESMRMIPDMELTIKDKILLLKIADALCSKFPTDEEVRAELPYFCAWARDFSIPEELAHNRFGVVAWHHPDLLAAAMAESPTQSTHEILDAWRAEWFKVVEAKEWSGTTTELLTRLLQSAAVGDVAGKTYRNAEALGRNVRKVMRSAPWIRIASGHRPIIIISKT